jgi:2-dehydro-3-deoxyphosphooctonate aldolase (KDO 8-P synthase)
MAVGVDGIFLETHPDPSKALCDGPTSLKLENLEAVLTNLKKIFATHLNT